MIELISTTFDDLNIGDLTFERLDSDGSDIQEDMTDVEKVQEKKKEKTTFFLSYLFYFFFYFLFFLFVLANSGLHLILFFCVCNYPTK